MSSEAADAFTLGAVVTNLQAVQGVMDPLPDRGIRFKVAWTSHSIAGRPHQPPLDVSGPILSTE